MVPGSKIVAATCVAMLALGALGLAVPEAEATNPVPLVSVLNLNNSNGYAGTITITFNTPMKATTNDADSLSKVRIVHKDTGTTWTNLAGAKLEFPTGTNNVVIRLTPDQQLRIQAVSESKTRYQVSGGAFSSVDTSTAWGGNGLNRWGFGTYAVDGTGPTIVAAEILPAYQ